jgi:aspartyl-tRNA(Asn)/glutamyl-tRNA(Gln) amidotransferase subunit B
MVKIGLEIHGYINTTEKLFCSCKAIHGKKHAKPNTNICSVCTGQPGSKPELPNSSAINKTIEIALILGCKVNEKLSWQRKHYSWPDLPKGFQNTMSGPHAIENGTKGEFEGIRITECHLEEDPAQWNPKTGEIDYNRSGSPLIEIVTEPDFKSKEEVIDWLKKLLATLSYIKAIDKKAGIKADVNISIKGGKRVELKNVTGLKNISLAIETELKRQEKDLPKIQQTRRFDDKKLTTQLMRTKENAADYRFIADPDLPKLKISKKRIEKLKKNLPETPKEKLEKLIKKYKIEKKYAEILTKKLEIVEFFENIIEHVKDKKLGTRYITEELLSVLNYNKIDLEDIDLNPKHFIELVNLISEGKINELKAKDILRSWKEKSISPKKEAEASSINSSEITSVAKKILKENPLAVKQYKEGEEKVINLLIGQVIRITEKRADFSSAKRELEKLLT